MGRRKLYVLSDPGVNKVYVYIFDSVRPILPIFLRCQNIGMSGLQITSTNNYQTFEVQSLLSTSALRVTFLVRSSNNIHYLVVNAPTGQITQGDVIIPYIPFTRDGTYFGEVYEQVGLIPQGSITPYTPNLLGILQASMRLIASTSIQYSTCTRDVQDNFVNRESLTTEQGKYCSCVPQVQVKGRARNPYAVCAKSTGTTYRECWKYYDYNKMPSDILRDYASRHGVDISNKNDCQIAKEMTEWRDNKIRQS